MFQPPDTSGHWFNAELCELRVKCDSPSYQQIIALHRRFGELYGDPYGDLPPPSKTALSNILGGRKRLPSWEQAAVVVLACQYHGHQTACLLATDPGPVTLLAWHDRLRAAREGRPQVGLAPYTQLPFVTPLRAGAPEPGHLRYTTISGDPAVATCMPRYSAAGKPELPQGYTPRYRQADGPPGSPGEQGQPATDVDGALTWHPEGHAPDDPPAAPLAAPVGAPAWAQAGMLIIETGGSGREDTRLDVDELLERIRDDRRRADHPFRRVSTSYAPDPQSDGIDALRWPEPLDPTYGSQSWLRNPNYQELLGEHGVTLLLGARSDADAAARLGVLCTCAQWDDNAERWLRAAADHGDAAAHALLATARPWRRTIAGEIAYDLALPQPGMPDAEFAEVYYRAAADTGHLGAMYRLALLCHARDATTEAAYWYNQAATDGHPHARHQFEQIHAEMIRDGFDLVDGTHLPDTLTLQAHPPPR